MIARNLDANRIRAIHLFKNVSESHFQALLRAASVRDIRPRSILFKERSRPNTLYLLLDGLVELFSEYRDKRRTIELIRSPEPCALASMWQDRYQVSARTLAPSRLLLVPAKRVRDLMETDGGFATAAAIELAKECLQTVEQLKDNSFRTAAERVASWVLRFDNGAGGTGQFLMPCDKRTLASYLGMAPEHLSRNLAALASAGLVVRGRRVALKSRSALAGVAKLHLAGDRA